MNCLESLVGLEDCELSPAPFLINDIGFDYDQIGEFIDGSYQTVEDFFAANVRTAARLLESDIYSKLPAQMRSASVLEGNTVASYPESRKSFTGTGIAGIRQNFHNSGDYLKIRIKNIRLFTDHTGDIDVKVWNMNTGQEIGSTTISVEAGKIINKEVDIEIASQKQDLNLFIGYDTTGISAYNAELYRSGCCGNYTFRSGFCTFSYGTIASPFILSSFTSGQQSPGLSFDYEIVCDNLQWICTHRSLFGMAMVYKTAIAILEHGLDSGSQFSNQQTTNYEKNVSRLETATNHYNDQITKSLASMKFPRNRCFTCETITSVHNRLPG